MQKIEKNEYNIENANKGKLNSLDYYPFYFLLVFVEYAKLYGSEFNTRKSGGDMLKSIILFNFKSTRKPLRHSGINILT
jgi:hypothetical protein